MLKHSFELKSCDFNMMLDEIILCLKKRSQLWLNQIQILCKKLKESIDLYISKKINSFKEVSKFIEGDNEQLNQAFKAEVILDIENLDMQLKMLGKFK